MFSFDRGGIFEKNSSFVFMANHHSFTDTVDQIVTDGVIKGILHLHNEDECLSGNTLVLKGEKVVNFGSCSYLGLEFDRRLKEGVKQAVDNYGTQFSESRAYVSVRLYDTLESRLRALFEAAIVVVPTTTLGHIAAIPVLVGDSDAVILDHQVHNSVQTAVTLLKPRGIHVELLRHNRLDLLEERIKILRQKYSRIWYMADGIYSMYGDVSPVDEVRVLMNQYPELHYYVDDAHGMSCFGKHGRGYVLGRQPIHERMVVAASLNKSFASGGGALVFGDAEMARRVRTCGGPLITSGPMQPGALGAAVASAGIHLSDEIYSLQEDLHENIRYTNLLLGKYGLPAVSVSGTPVFFIGVSLPKMGYNMVRRMFNEGYYLNLGIFPAVPMKNTGVRFTITRLHTFAQIESMIGAMAHHLPQALADENISMEHIYKAFKMQMPEEKQIDAEVSSILNKADLRVVSLKSINEIDREEWDSMYAGKGSFDYEGMRFLEQTFSGNLLKENNWDFDYFFVKDRSGKTLLAAFFTSALAKDDMLSPAAVSMQLEKIRNEGDAYYLTSKVLSLGSLLTEGEHLYVDRTSPFWKDAMHLMFEKISALQEQYQAVTVTLRDFHHEDEEMDSFLVDNGYFKIRMPENHSIDKVEWTGKEEYLRTLTPSSAKHVKRYIFRYEEFYDTRVVTNPSPEEVNHWYQLYLNVKSGSYVINTFQLPFKAFENIVSGGHWDIITLSLKPGHEQAGETPGKPVAVMLNYISGDTYNFMIIGLDYRYQDDFKPYKQALYQVVKRAQNLGLKKIHLGFTTSSEKKKIGATIFTPVAYVQAKDNYNMAVLGNISVVEARL